MEMNLYGISSIKLDKIRGYQIKSSIKWLFVAYLLVLIISMMLPQRLFVFKLGEAE